MENKWKTIWNKKEADISEARSEYEIFRELKRADGFDVAVENADEYYKSFYEEWLAFYDKLTELSQGPVKSVFEVGCGSGVNLFMFKNRGVGELGGVDYSDTLTQSARAVTGSEDIYTDEAVNISCDRQYDLVMSESVFQYFSNLEYAENVLRKMLKKSRGIVYLGEIHDARFEKELMEYRRKTIEDYDKKYEGLSKQFYKREWIEKIAGDREVIYTEVKNKEYLNSKSLFNCFILPLR